MNVKYLEECLVLFKSRVPNYGQVVVLESKEELAWEFKVIFLY